MRALPVILGALVTTAGCLFPTSDELLLIAQPSHVATGDAVRLTVSTTLTERGTVTIIPERGVVSSTDVELNGGVATATWRCSSSDGPPCVGDVVIAATWKTHSATTVVHLVGK